MFPLWLELGSQMENDRLDYEAASPGRWQEKHGREKERLAEAWRQRHCQRTGKCPDSATKYWKYCQLLLPSLGNVWSQFVARYVPHRLHRAMIRPLCGAVTCGIPQLWRSHLSSQEQICFVSVPTPLFSLKQVCYVILGCCLCIQTLFYPYHKPLKYWCAYVCASIHFRCFHKV